MAYHIIENNRLGKVEYSLDNPTTDVLALPKRGIQTGSTASGFDTTTGGLIVYWFTASVTPNTDGSWNEI